MVPRKVHFLEVDTVIVEEEQSRFELETPLVDGHSVPDMPCRRSRYVLVRFAVEGYLELANTGNTIEETEKMDTDPWPAKRLLELVHVPLQLLVLLGLWVVVSGILEVAKRLPGELNHFLVSH